MPAGLGVRFSKKAIKDAGVNPEDPWTDIVDAIQEAIEEARPNWGWARIEEVADELASKVAK